jgi:hypothetical protein
LQSLIVERVKGGLLAARKRWRIAAIRKVQMRRDATWLDRLLAQLDT